MEHTKKQTSNKKSQLESPDLSSPIAVHRCPYCHEGVQTETRVVCRDCLAPHHSACWEESSQCGSCQSARNFPPEKLDHNLARRILIEHGFSQQQVEGLFQIPKVNPVDKPRAWPGLLVVIGVAAFFLVGYALAETHYQAFHSTALAWLIFIGTALSGSFGSWWLCTRLFMNNKTVE
jgi:hypothetical protein